MGLISITVLILIFVLLVSKVTGLCRYNERYCPSLDFYLQKDAWCCLVHDKCGQAYRECESKWDLSKYLVIFVPACILGAVFFRCVLLCINYGCMSNGRESTDNYQPVIIISDPVDQESSSPPSYEEVVNGIHPYRLGSNPG